MIDLRTRPVTEAERLPSVEQIETAQIPLATARDTAVGIGYYVLSRQNPYALDVFRRSLVDNLRQAAAALGYRLEPIGPVLAIDNSARSEA